MSADTVFEFVAQQLEQTTDFDKLEARGTVRLALKQSGLEAKGVTPDQMAVVLEKVLPGELKTRGVESPDSVCGSIVQALKGAGLDAGGGGDQSPEAVFKRIGGG